MTTKDSTDKNSNGTPKFALLKLFFITYINAELGLLVGVFGASLPSLVTYFHSSLQVISAVYLTFGIGGALASVLASPLYKCIDVNLFMASAMFMFGSGVMLFPVTRNVIVAFVFIFVAGLGSGSSMNGVYSYCSVLFPNNAYSFHVISMSLSLGTVLGPIIAQRFIDPTLTTITNDSQIANVTLELIHRNSSQHVTSAELAEKSSSSMFYLYALQGLLSVIPVIGHCMFFLREGKQTLTTLSQQYKYNNLGERRTWSKVCFIGLFLSLSMTAYGLGYVHGNYVTTIAEEGHLRESVFKATWMNSIFWMSFCLGRLFCIGLSLVMRQVTIMYMCLIGTIASMLILLVSVHQQEIVFWIGNISLGLFCGPQFPALLAWTREYITLTPLLIGMSAFMDYVGMTILPFIAGQLVSWTGEAGEIYFSLALAVYSLLLFVCSNVIGEVWLPRS